MMRTAHLPEGFEQGEFEGMVGKVAGRAVQNRLERWVGTTDPLPYAAVLRKAGIEAAFEHPSKDEDARKSRRKVVGTLGLEVAEHGEFLTVRNVDPAGAAAAAGVNVGDLVVAVGGRRVTRDDWRRLFRSLVPGKGVPVALFRHDRLRLVDVTPREDARKVARATAPEKVPADALRIRRAWLGTAAAFPKTSLDPTKP
jgi:predicted metalloprotease with PDZ domain